MWLALPVVIAFGAGVGYLAAQLSAPPGQPPAAASHAAHGDTAHGDTAHTGSGDGTGHDDAPAAADGASHDVGAGHAGTVDRPRATVLISFGVVNAGILAAAVVLRRRDRRTPRARGSSPRTA
jgi:hypothetical protein